MYDLPGYGIFLSAALPLKWQAASDDVNKPLLTRMLQGLRGSVTVD